MSLTAFWNEVHLQELLLALMQVARLHLSTQQCFENIFVVDANIAAFKADVIDGLT